MTVSHLRRAEIEARFHSLFASRIRPLLAQAPGRVNLIGEHTDYNDGWVLPMAIDRYVWLAFAPSPEPRIRAFSQHFDETVDLDLGDLWPYRGSSWYSYLAGVAWAMQQAGQDVMGMDLVVDGDLPLASGLSSSAALEMATARAICAASGIPWRPTVMARLGQRAENEFIGVSCGLMDQLASAAAEPGCALLLDCRSLDTEAVPIPASARVIVMDTGAPRSLAGSAYNDRRTSCDHAVDELARIEPGILALRDVTPDLLVRAKDHLDESTYRRARHVVEENLRPHAFARALARNDLGRAGRLLDDSHASLRDLYEVSSRELDLITDIARRHPACYGARLTGAGFGGCAIALVAAGAEGDFIERVRTAYGTASGLAGDLFACEPTGGARLVETIPAVEADTASTPED